MFDSIGFKVSGWLFGVAFVFSFFDYGSIFNSHLFVFIFEVFLSVSALFFMVLFSFYLGGFKGLSSEIDLDSKNNFSFYGGRVLGFIVLVLFLFFGFWILFESYMNNGEKILSFIIGVEFIVFSVTLFYFTLCSFLKGSDK
ncbi:hypothetical protein [Oceanospirillum maris]|uniref:hypothetical protein n=1 Tax=Oceanospirillum maris TaxID=64977 RepID=UPI00047F195C|nr:hypothetical protein [Oceanospirillum maris]